MKTRRTEVTIETDEIWIIRRSASGIAARCAECARQTTMITLDEAAQLAELDPRDVQRLVIEGRIHNNGPAGDLSFICSNSIASILRDSSSTLMKRVNDD